MKRLIKICGIQQPEVAYQAACAGADFIGIVFAPESRRCVDVNTAAAIAERARAGGAVPVGVFTQADSQAIQRICARTGIDHVQLHGELAREQAAILLDTLTRIYACRVLDNGQINQQDLPGIQALSPTRDYLLFDGIHAGSGQAFAWENFSYTGESRWFLSGGLRCDNVAQALAQLHPTGVDVSSGVEDKYGDKSLELISKFIAQIK